MRLSFALADPFGIGKGKTGCVSKWERMESRLFEEVGRGWADAAHAPELQPGHFCVSCAFSRLSPALPVFDPGRSFYRGGRGVEGEPVPRTYFSRDVAAAEVGGALTQLPIQAFAKHPDLTPF